MPTLMQCFIWAVLVLLLCLPTQASHFRFYTVNWSRDANNPNTVHFQVQHAWRKTAFFGLSTNAVGLTSGSTMSFQFGDGTAANLPMVVTAQDNTEDWIFGVWEYNHTYASSTQTYTARSATCCRIGGLQNGNSGDSFQMETVVTGGAHQGPLMTSVPIKDMVVNQPNSFFLPVLASRGGTLSFAISTTTQSALTTASPPGLVLNANTGEITFSPTVVGGLYAIQFRVSETTADGVTTTTPVDFIIRGVQAVASDPSPEVGIPGLCAAHCTSHTFTVSEGQTISFTVQGEDTMDANNNVVRIISLNQPSGSSISTCSQGEDSNQFSLTQGVCTKTFTWTVPLGASSSSVLFTATDGSGQNSQTMQVILNVIPQVPDTAPQIGLPGLCAAPCSAHTITVTKGQTATFTVQGDDTLDVHNNVVKISSANLPPGSTLSQCSQGEDSSGFSSTEGSCTETFSWAVPSSAASSYTLSFTATDGGALSSSTLQVTIIVSDPNDCSTCTNTYSNVPTDADYYAESVSTGTSAKLCFT